jgi:Flp pilus assembly protein protease CpaA
LSGIILATVIILLIIAMTQDVLNREVYHSITLAMLLLTFLHLIIEVQFTWQFIIVFFSVTTISFLFWFLGIWGGSDSKWLILSMPWLDLSTWGEWCLLFSILLSIYLIFSYFKSTQSLALLAPMNSASIILILFYQWPIWSHL